MSEALLAREAVRLHEVAADREAAVTRCGEVLVDIGAAEPGYIAAMLAREESISTYVGEQVAIPHGTLAGKELITRDALAVLRFAEPVDWDGHPVRLCVAIAARGNGHVALLAALAEVLMDPAAARTLRDSTDIDEVIALLGAVGKDSTA